MGVLILARDEVRVRLLENAADDALPVLTYDGAITFHLNGEEVYAAPVPPAHTDGDSYIHFRESDVVHTGDLYAEAGYPFIDRARGGTLDGSIAALDLLIDLAGPDTKFIPGYGEVSTRDDVMAWRYMIVDVRDRVAALVVEGRSFEEVLAARPTATYDARWGDADRFLRAVHAEVGG